MDPVLVLSAFLVAALIVLVLVVRYYRDRVSQMRDELQDASLARRRAAEAQDRWAKQWAPVFAAYPFDARSFRYLGGPVDGVQFEQDRVALVTFTGEGRPEPDARVRDLVRAGRVDWVEVRLGPKPPEPEPAASEPASGGTSSAEPSP